jgi:Dyp-type peroxidase family
MNNDQRGFLCCVPIRCDPRWPGVQVSVVEERLAALGNPAQGPIAEALGKCEVIHFMSMSVVWDGARDDPPFLVVDVTGDGDCHRIISALVDAAGDLLAPVFEAAKGAQTRAQLAGCLKQHAYRAGALMQALAPGRTLGLAFQGTPGLSVKRIRQDRAIEQAAKLAVDQQSAQGRPESAKAYWRAAQAAVLQSGLSLAPVAQGKAKAPRPSDTPGQIWAMVTKSWLAGSQALLIAAVAVGLFGWIGAQDKLRFWPPSFTDIMLLLMSLAVAVLTVGLLLAVTLVWLARTLRLAEDADKPTDRDPDVRCVDQIMERENRLAQNHMIGVSAVKPGWFRSLIGLPLALYIVGLAVKARIFMDGYLSDVGTIHCAQWMRLPGTRKLLFLSNYDGSWQSYLEDFITKASAGITAIWSNTEDFPKARWLFLDGATDGERFKRWARRQQIPTLFWYSAYPDLTTQQIRTNVLIREVLTRPIGGLTEADCQAWLERFGSTPRPYYTIDTTEVQGLVLSGHRNLLHGVCLVVDFPAGVHVDACRAWLAEVLQNVTFDQPRRETEALSVGLTAHGLDRLGVAGVFDPMPRGRGPLYSNFPSAFVLGMVSPTRARVLGDVGKNAPEHWTWGGRQNPVHAELLIYAKTPAALQAAEAREASRLEQHGLRPAARVRLKELPPLGEVVREPFGFVDGISQPAIKGVLSSRTAHSNDLVEPGEFILGYPDGRQQFPPTPQVDAAADTGDLLPNLPQDFPASEGRPADVRDLGQNGSFLVIRQLEQNVAAFDAFLHSAATKLGPPNTGREDWLAAKLVGRWKDGAPLVCYPVVPPQTYDITHDMPFLFGLQDPQGLACPFGAHIRRANPRDSFGATDPDQIGLTNRHRLLRRGRTYVAGDNAEAVGSGILFMCLNADIERQFEFVHQTWIGSNSFDGLVAENDPIVVGGGDFTVPLASGPEHVTGLQSFVTVVGGGYFFLPSKSALQFLSKQASAAGAAKNAAAAAFPTPPQPPGQRRLPSSPSDDSTRTPDLVTATSPSRAH